VGCFAVRAPASSRGALTNQLEMFRDAPEMFPRSMADSRGASQSSHRTTDAESGEMSLGGSTATCGQNNLDEIGRTMGVTCADTEELKVGELKTGARAGTSSEIRVAHVDVIV
jgi:hypothetical protein